MKKRTVVILAFAGLLFIMGVFLSKEQRKIREDIITPTLIGTPTALLGQPGVVAGIDVTQHFPSGLLTLNRNATTTTSLPIPSPDLSLNPDTMRVISIEPFVLVQKPDGVHVEYIYDSGIVTPENFQKITAPELISGGVVFRDTHGTVRVYALGDGGVIAGLPSTPALLFAASSTRYLMDEQGVYFLAYTPPSVMLTSKNIAISKVQGADPKTFTVLYPEANFAKDHAHYFLNEEIVDDMTPKNAHPLPHRNDPSYYSGVDTVYIDSQRLYHIGFVMDPSEQYSGVRYRDRGTITRELLSDVSYRKVADVNPERDQYTKYAVKSDGVWYGAMNISSADNARFELIIGLSDFFSLKGGVSYEYARDESYAYYKGVQIPNADRNTLLPLPLNSAYAADKAHVFFGGQIIPNANPATFEPLWYPIYEGCLLGAYAKDARTVFYKNQTVIGADPNSFKALYDEYGRDKRGIYFQGVFRAEINPQNFTEPVCNYG